MTEKLVDILNAYGSVLHTYPVTLTGGSDGDYMKKALEAAASGQLVPNEELSGLSARMHQSRSGRLAPEGDRLPADSQTKSSLEQEVRERAYYLWEAEGRLEGRSEEYWNRALDQHLRDRSYILWEQQGRPEGQAGSNRAAVEKFEER